MYDKLMFGFQESLVPDDYMIATYYMEIGKDADAVKFAQAIAAEQSSGTWIDVPYNTENVRAKHSAVVVGLYEVPAYDRELPKDIDCRRFIMKMAYPVINVGDSLSMIHTTAIGNISGGKMKLVDMEFPESYMKQFKGPKFGIKGIRDILGVPERPLVLNMIKPDVGWSPKQGAEMAYSAYSGGVDIIKDDELVAADTSFCPLTDRVKAIMEVLHKAEEETGEKKIYTPNITDRVDRLKDNAYRAIEAGANGLMVNIYTVGYTAFQMLAEDPNIQVPILAHPDYAAATFSAPDTGVASYLMMGKFVRMSGADIMIYSTHFGKISIMRDRYIQTAQALRYPLYHIKDAFPGPGGGMYQGIVPQTMEDLGNDCIIAAGGAIHGHPMGADAGAKSMRQAIDSVMKKVPIREYAKDKPELNKAIELWGANDKTLFDMKA